MPSIVNFIAQRYAFETGQSISRYSIGIQAFKSVSDGNSIQDNTNA